MRLVPTVLLCAALALPAAAKPPLRDVAEIDNALMAIAIADEIRKTCDGINARLILAYTTINALKSRAESLGYTEDEIDAYVTSKSEKDRMRAKATAYLASKGVDAKDKGELCAFGKAEIASDSAIGRLLR
ncbi:DUF5333 domain-containing protein [Thetidibacter halocola]|uniref:DUF5333 domain-containing protein n=1 Tax=Thetidibacter halocola TaxID=2827239 RepID=A0A8J7WB39_9RHOB|nr:DUF5333 domain-containing protein [Thetidibacter halocola]MBS0124295.1 DUF5333 domain-containing protein [Thetidibacter halocola]